VPAKVIVETKSLKLFMQSFRERPQFNERLVVEIGETLWNQLKPRWLHVEGRFKARGGICPSAVYERGDS